MAIFFLTGAARGIGLELARQLSAFPNSILIALVRTVSDQLKDLQSQRTNIHILKCDITSPQLIAEISDALPTFLGPSGKISHVINNAAVLGDPDSEPLTLSSTTLLENINANVLGPAKIVEATLPFLAPNALIVNFSSGIGSLKLVSDGTIASTATAYSISKSALNMLTVHQAQHLKGRHRVVCLDPGHVKTRMGGSAASVDVGDSAKGIIDVLNLLDAGDLGGSKDCESGRARFYNFRGEEVPW
ncbi:NAD(P)-binding protein [Lophiostoma macrostomum CBS 122681]|uniref:NAD(P)-binding protein n=1 Tax=Lophiostoma macrostomum CBS 122681 TaxID=1314788 RepID=A0A6A6TV29_9PLEO|nr:NAD(P)-binding protein [Lophiostoma macrostomum CBS 122681]